MNTPRERPVGGGSNASPSPNNRFQSVVSRARIITAAAAVLLLAGLSLLAFSLSARTAQPLYPNLPTFTRIAETVTFEAVSVGFAELNADPAAFQDQRLQVTGEFTPVDPPACLDFNGPHLQWSLVADELQLNAIGFEDVLRLVSPDTELTVTGIWRAYQGPMGCGKEPPDGTVWYLAVDQILKPNPLFGAADPALTMIAGTPQNNPLLDDDPTSMPNLTSTPSGTSPATTPLPGAPIVTPTVLTPAGIPTQMNTTPASGIGTPTPAGTPTGSPTPGPSPTPMGTGAPGGTTTPSIPTATPSGTGYPSQPTPPGGYP
jgi:hypothetical protein